LQKTVFSGLQNAQKIPRHKYDRGFSKFSSNNLKLALGELGSATCGLQTVLHGAAGLKTPVPQGFSASAKQFNP